ncbi:MAG: DsrC family protein [Ramlibacter sp.]|jgi:tRNA 2-thiouridine synthesizing protein E|nr:DsrC family protein [Ramlibacter sp.]MCE3269867.1 DsrC family protein [Ramlibacter sp.]
MGATMQPDMQRTVHAGGRDIPTDSEGYLRNLQDWSEDFTRALAREENLVLTQEHWEVIRFLRDYYQQHGVQAQVRVMIRHFTARWGTRRGSNHYLHALFPIGGPQKQGNRLAGLLRTKGEH